MAHPPEQETRPLLAENPPYGSVLVSPLEGAAVDRSEGNGMSGETFDNVPQARRQLGLSSAAFLIFNRVIGTGIFATPSAILLSSGSVGIALIMWVLGALIAIASTIVYVELGTGLPRSGGEKNYLEYMYRRPKFLVTCTYGVYTLVSGSNAPNGLVFGQYTLNALNLPPTPFNTQLTALPRGERSLLMIGVFSRSGLRLLNTLGTFKFFILTTIAALGLLSLLFPALLPVRPEYETPDNLRSWEAFWRGGRGDANSLVTALYNVMWSFIGYSNANYALSEVRDPVKTIKRAAPLAILSVAAVYMLVNVAYFAVVSRTDILGSRQIIACVFVLIQELAREGITPLPGLFATNKPFGAPLAGLTVLYLISVVLVVAPPPGDAYLFLLSISSYSLTLINTFVSFGLLLLHTKAYRAWGWNPPFRAPRAVVVVVFVSNVFLALTPLVPPGPGQRPPYEGIPYYTHVLVTIAASQLGVLYWWIWSIWLPRRNGYTLKREWEVQEDGVSRFVFVKVPAVVDAS
ncbi:high affinity methionine permease [Favolaschia claudopus]|uniref:High affinity methionine permease n=1 Tax=Favolaschia claudopus TaxID=2862362 RepID=A0AAV9ZV83_9AGAR